MESTSGKFSFVMQYGHGHALVPDSNGCIGRLEPGEVLLTVRWKASSPVYVFHVAYYDGKMFPDRQHSRGKDMHAWRVYPVKISEQGIYHAEYPFNCEYVAFANEKGELEVRCVGMASQQGNFYVFEEVAYRCGENFENSVPPYGLQISDLVEMRDQVAPVSGQWIDIQRGFSDDPMLLEGVPRGLGRIYWWSVAKGLGAAATYRGPVRLHWENIIGVTGLARLHVGDVVSIDSLRPPVSTKGRPSTAFKFDGVGIHKQNI